MFFLSFILFFFLLPADLTDGHKDRRTDIPRSFGGVDIRGMNHSRNDLLVVIISAFQLYLVVPLPACQMNGWWSRKASLGAPSLYACPAGR